jgi:hypothetical protein
MGQITVFDGSTRYTHRNAGAPQDGLARQETKAAFNLRRCTLIKVSIERKELPPVTTARMENSRT